MKIFNVTTAVLAIGFAAILIWATLTGEFWAESQQIAALAWGQVMLIDLYIGLFIVATAIFFLEQSALSALLWISLVLILGNVASLVYFLFRSKKLKSIFCGD